MGIEIKDNIKYLGLSYTSRGSLWKKQREIMKNKAISMSIKKRTPCERDSRLHSDDQYAVDRRDTEYFMWNRDCNNEKKKNFSKFAETA